MSPVERCEPRGALWEPHGARENPADPSAGPYNQQRPVPDWGGVKPENKYFRDAESPRKCFGG